MLRTTIVTLACVLVVAGCDNQPPPAGKAADKAPAAKVDTPPTQPQPTPPPEAKVEPPPTEPPPTEPAPVDTAAVDTAAVDTAGEPPTEPEAPTAPAAGGSGVLGGWKAPEGADIRSDAAIPPGTPAANAEAFKKLPVAKGDGPTVSAIGPSGIHFDTMVVGRGWEKSRCVEATNTFDLATDDRASICLRVVHPSDAEEVLTVEWNKVGSKATRRSTVTVKAMHAFLTRTYLPIKTGYEGEWSAAIKTADGTTLATVNFTVK